MSLGEVTAEGTLARRDAVAEIEALRREVERLSVLARSERGLVEAIVNNSPHGVLVCDAAGKMTLQNRAAERIWAGSASPESVAGWGAYRAFHADGRPYAAGDWAMARCLSHGETIQPHEIDVLKFDDSCGVLLGSCAPIFGEDGAIAGAISVFADVTSFKQLEVALKAAHADTELLYHLTDSVARAETIEQVFATALETITAGLHTERASILLFDDAGVMRFRAWRGLSEDYRRAVDGHSPWTPDDVAPHPVLVQDAETDPTMKDYRPVFRAEGIRTLGFFPLVHGGRLIGKFMVYGAAPRGFPPRDVRIALAVGSHVAQGVARMTAGRQIERLLAETTAAKAAAEQAVRARDEVLAAVSHDLRNQLNTLSLSASSLTTLASKAGPGNLGNIAHRLQRTLSSMNRLIGDLLDVGAIDAGALHVEPVDCGARALLDAAVDLLRPLADERELRLVVACNDGLALRADTDRITQVLANVVGNAIKFTPVGGTIRIAARAGGDASFVEFEVADSGPGIAPDHLPRVFDRFWRPKSRVRGVGLGLAIARGIVEAHGGRIAAESPPGAGAIIRFTLPAR